MRTPLSLVSSNDEVVPCTPSPFKGVAAILFWMGTAHTIIAVVGIMAMVRAALGQWR